MKENNRVDFNIEYAHIYSNEVFNAEHYKSLEVLKFVIEILEKTNKTYNLTILIDEYHPDEKFLNVKDFLNKLEQEGFSPNYLYLESALNNDINLLIKDLSPRFVNEYNKYTQKNNGKSPCSFLVAIWYLKRLGILPIEELEMLDSTDKPFQGKRLINILSAKYKSSEDKALQILKNSSYKDNINNIIYYYY